jgi:hypothetical protein
MAMETTLLLKYVKSSLLQHGVNKPSNESLIQEKAQQNPEYEFVGKYRY